MVPTTSCVPPPTSGNRTVIVPFSRGTPRVVPVQTVLKGITAWTAVQPKLSTPMVVGMNTAGTPRGAVFVGPVAVRLKVGAVPPMIVPVTAPVTVQTAPDRAIQPTPAWPEMVGGLMPGGTTGP